ncbi:MAG: BPL-N domain-containing protein [Planctomycetota bacterium]|nr:BPL-N domain-containing protein [Planctomycetota bacterium]
MKTNFHFPFCLGFLLTCLIVRADANAADELEASVSPTSLVTVERGDLPIILTAPHGGTDSIPNVPRRLGEGVSKFSSLSDVGTAQLGIRLADAIERKFGKRPYLVVAHFHRRYIDANRPTDLAFEVKPATKIYNRYHEAIVKARHEVAERWGHGLLLDIHGQATDPQAIFRGTQNGQTTKHLVSRFGNEALRGKTSLFGQLALQGFRVIPAVNDTKQEHNRYDGGFTVVKYGSNRGGTIDAIQLEFGRSFRNADAVDRTAERIANAVFNFSNDYLPRQAIDPGKLPTSNPQELIKVAVYVDQGVERNVNDLFKALAMSPDLRVDRVKAADIREGDLDKYDVLIQPGGSGSGQARHLGPAGREHIRDFIAAGGGYIGICAGAYLASADYDWSLHILDAKVIDRKHWARGRGEVEIGLTEMGRVAFQQTQPKLRIHYSQGPLLAPADRDDIEDYEVIASYETEIAKNGAPKGVMQGTTAIAQGKFGEGQVFCFSPHPEKTQGLESLVLHAVQQVRKPNRANRQLIKPAN